MKRLCSSIIPLLLLALALPGLAQTVTGAVRGTVTDATGAIVAGAEVYGLRDIAPCAQGGTPAAWHVRSRS